MNNKDLVKIKSEYIIDTTKFHVGCAYFVQSSLDDPWVGILISVDERYLSFITDSAIETKTINIDNLIDQNIGFNLTLLVPASDDKTMEVSKETDPVAFEKYMDKEKRASGDIWI